MKPKITKKQAAKNVFAKLGLPWKRIYDGSNGGTITADAWRAIDEHLDKKNQEKE